VNVSVGIDVGAKALDVVVRQAGKNGKVERFEQSPKGHQALLRRIKAFQPTYVVMEATGIYYLDLAVALYEAQLPVSIINPKSYKHFVALMLKQSKTDPLDAALLAEYGDRMTPAQWIPPDPMRLALRDIGRQINRLTATRTQAKNRLHALQSKSCTMPLLIEDELEGISMLDKRIDRLQQTAQALIQENQTLKRQFEHLSAAKGVGMASATILLGELCILPIFLKAPQVSRYAGMDIRLYQSGSSIDRPARLSKAGNAYLRAALFMPAMTAIQHDPRAKAFYEALVARGKKKIQALCAVMRKYLTGFWACIKQDTPFDSSALFSDIHLKKV